MTDKSRDKEIYGLDISPKRKSALPENFAINDDHRRYCTEKWNLPYLADVFLDDFRECFELNGRKHFDWDVTFKNYLRNSAPGGRFYNHIYWQDKCTLARRKEYPEQKRAAPVYHPREIPPPSDPKTAHEACRNLLKMLRA